MHSFTVPGALLLLAAAGVPLWAQSADPPPAVTSQRRIAALEQQVQQLERATAALHAEIRALELSAPIEDPPAAEPASEPAQAAVLLAASVDSLRGSSSAISADYPAGALLPASDPPAMGAAAGAAGDLSAWNPFNGMVPIGLLDVYYSYNEHQPISGLNSLRPFDGQTNQLALGLLELGVARQPVAQARLGYRLTGGFGDSINAVNSSDPGGLGFAQYLHEGYAAYLVPLAHGLRTDVGKFDTAIGAESMESPDNWNYSRSFLYNYAVPFYGFGIRPSYAFSDKYAVTGYLVNGWNNLVDTYSSGKTKGFEFAWRPTQRFQMREAWLTGRGATEDTQEKTVSDAVARYAVTSHLALMADAVYGRSEEETPSEARFFWTGAAAYARYRFNTKWAAAARLEYYDDHGGLTTCGACAAPTPQDLREATLTGERKVDGHLLGRLEYRYDTSTAPVFYRAATPIRDQATLTLGLVYMLQSFGAASNGTR